MDVVGFLLILLGSGAAVGHVALGTVLHGSYVSIRARDVIDRITERALHQETASRHACFFGRRSIVHFLADPLEALRFPDSVNRTSFVSLFRRFDIFLFLFGRTAFGCDSLGHSVFELLALIEYLAK